jgi:hypothetical protein
MKTRYPVLAVLAILCGLMMGFEPQSRVYKIDVRVFQIPPIQTVTSAGPDEKGNIVGTTKGGDVTAGFPGHPVVLQTDLAPGAGEEVINGILSDQKILPRSSYLPLGVRWTLAERYSISCPERDLGTHAGRKEYHEPEVVRSAANPSEGRAEYWLTISPVSADDREAILSLKYRGFGNVLFDQDVKVTLNKITIVGFPQYGGDGKRPEPRGTVCILILQVQRQGT